MRKYWPGLALILVAAIGSAQDQGKKKGPAGPPFMMMIPELKDGGELPVKYSCANAPAGVSPQIQWMNAPMGTQSFAILLHDPEAHPQKGIYDVTHWLIWNIPATAKELPEGLPSSGELPDGSRQVKRGPQNPPMPGYFGPCAGPALAHHYTFELYALDTKLDPGADATRADVMKAMDGHILGSAVFVTMYHRQ